MLQKHKSFLEQYLESAFEQIEAFKGVELSDEQKEYITKLASDNYVDPDVVLSNSVKNIEMSMYLSKIIEMYVDKEAIMTGYGTLYKNQSLYDSIICKLLAYFMDERKVVKKEMIKLIGSGVPKSDIRVKVLDQRQKVLKLLANSFYGAYAEKSFIFYNRDAAPSVTYNGRLIIGYTLYLFETMLMDNHWLTEPDELYVYVTACRMKAEDSSLEDLGENPNLPDSYDEIRAKVRKKLISYCAPSDSTWNPEEVVDNLLKDVSDEDLLSLYFRGDIYHFFEYSEVSESFKALLEGGSIVEADYGWLDKNYPDVMEFLNSLWEYIEAWVLTPNLQRDINHKIENMKRKSVILTDTDSTFREQR